MTLSEFYTIKIESEGIPIFGVGVGRNGVRVDFTSEATEAQVARANEIIQTIPSNEDLAIEELTILKNKIADNLNGNDPNVLLVRAILKIIYASIVETRLKINEIITKNPLSNVSKLNNRSWLELMEIAKQQIKNE